MLTDFNRRSLTTSLVLLTLFSLAGIFWIVSSQSSLLDEYPRIELKAKIIGKIVSVEPSKSIVRIQLQNQQKFTIPASRNYSYSPPDLNLFIKEGDKIKKPHGSDTFFIYRDNQTFLFLLGKFLDMPEIAGTNNIPQPDFDLEIEALRNGFKKKYNAKTVIISHPYNFSDNVLKHWIKIEFVDAQFKNETFSELGREVAHDTYKHIRNIKDFDKIEVSTIQKKGFIVRMRSQKSAFFYRDSL